MIDEINSLLRLGVGDQYRLEHIKLAYVENRSLWESDRRYLERMREKYLTDLRPGEPVDDDRDVAAAAAAASEPRATAIRPPDAPPPSTAEPPSGGSTSRPEGARPPPPPGSPESAARDAEDFGADAEASEGPAVIHCWQCGKKNLLKANFCMRCGVLLFEVGSKRASADSSAYASSSLGAAPGARTGPARRGSAARDYAPAAGDARPFRDSGRPAGRSSGRRTVLIGIAALVGIMIVVGILTGSIGVESSVSVGNGTDTLNGPAAGIEPEPQAAPAAGIEPEPEPQAAPGGRAPPPPPPDPGEQCGAGTILVDNQCVPAP